MELKELIEEYQTIRSFAIALSKGDAELAIMDEGGVTPISKLFGNEVLTESAQGALVIYAIELMGQMRRILDEDEKEMLSHPDLPDYERRRPESPADISVGMPKNDYRRHSTEDDGR